MNRVIASLLALSLLFAPLPTTALETKTLTKVMQSVVRLQIDNGSTVCTGFVVMPERVMTAAHCIDPEYPLHVDGLDTTVLKTDVPRDLALLEVKGLKRPSLTFTRERLEIGQKLTAIGFPHGGSALVVLDRRVAGMNLTYESCDMFTGECLTLYWTVIVNGTYAPGMSGGPNVNAKGQIVSITQAGIGTLGLGQSAEVMTDFLRSR